ncbi:hemerythrin [Arthrobacter alpinus]|uniref:Hemerythrin n=1 Tax=Arthrobacter alpinus TaxID=656366 RepID=A0A0M5LYA6_9MICC|nr:hemerythrin [Arthrobacter alpinus]
MPEPVAAAVGGGPATGGCACGDHDEPGLSELDTRVIPHAIRHATIFGALEGLTSGRGILLIANHNPLPLLAQLEQRSAGKFAVDYVENGPELWKLSMVRN